MLLLAEPIGVVLVDCVPLLNVFYTDLTILFIVILVICISSFILSDMGCGSPHVLFPSYLFKIKNLTPDFLAPSYVFYILPYLMYSFLFIHCITFSLFHFFPSPTLFFILFFVFPLSSFFSLSLGFLDARRASLFAGGGVMASSHDASLHTLPSHILMTGIPESSGFLTHVYMTSYILFYSFWIGGPLFLK